LTLCRNEEQHYCAVCPEYGYWKNMDLCSELNTMPVIRIINASWGHWGSRCWSNQTVSLGHACNDTAACTYTITDNADCPNDGKNYSAVYTCDGSLSNARKVYLPSAFDGNTVTLACTEAPTQSPTYVLELGTESSSSSLALFLTTLMLLSCYF